MEIIVSQIAVLLQQKKMLATLQDTKPNYRAFFIFNTILWNCFL